MVVVTPWHMLANAIITQACVDYATALRKKEEIEKKMVLSPDIGGANLLKIKELNDEMDQIERFIRSEQFHLYCGLDQEHFIKLLRERGGAKKQKHKTYKV